MKLFDSWAGALPGPFFERVAVEPARQITARIRAEHPDVPVIGFPRGAGLGYRHYAQTTGVQGMAIDASVPAEMAAAELQPLTCIQGNLDPLLMVTGGDALVSATRALVDSMRNGPYIFNLGHGITPDADPANVELLLKTIRG